MTTTPAVLGTLITSFFVQHLGAERAASRNTISSYRDAFRLLLRFLADSTGRPVARLTMDDLNAPQVLLFLDHLERERGNSARTRNARLAAIRSFFTYVLRREPAFAAQSQRVLAIPCKKAPGELVGYLSDEEVRAILAQPDRATALGRRDYLAIALLYDTGARVQALVDLRPCDFQLDRLPLVRIRGKGGKRRIVPLLSATASLVRDYIAETERSSDESEPLLRNCRGQPMTRSGITFILDKHRRRAAERLPSLARKGISPHVLRHTKAMHLLQAGVSPVTIKDILGHADIKTLDIYVQADLDMKRKAMESTPSPVDNSEGAPKRDPDILRWLEEL